MSKSTSKDFQPKDGTKTEKTTTLKSEKAEKTEAKVSPEYFQGLQRFIQNLLSKVPGVAERASSYIEPQYMNYWITAFTHESMSPTDNYEELEYYGDTVLKYLFPKYAMKRFPKLKKGQYTELNNWHMSKKFQGELSSKMRLPSQLRINEAYQGGYNLNINADIFESFFGALDTIGDEINFGLGPHDAYLVLKYIMDPVEISVEKTEAHPKSILQQMFKRQGLNPPIEKVVEDKTAATMTIHLTPASIKFLEGKDRTPIAQIIRRWNFSFPSDIIGEGTAPTKFGASLIAYNNALDNLKKMGITREFMEYIKHMSDMTDPAIQEYIPAMSAKLKKQGYKNPKFFTPLKLRNKSGFTMQLVAENAQGNPVTLGSIHGADQSQSRIALIRNYATEGIPSTSTSTSTS